MHHRRFGRTNLMLSVFSLGTMRFESEAVATAVVQRAIQAGINHLETARGYGQSERYLGTALQSLAISRSELYLTTKLPPLLEVEAMARAIDESLERLRVDYIDCLAIHGLNTWDHLAWVEQGGLQAVQQAKAAGKIGHLGFSTHGSRELILAAIATQQFEFVNLHYYYFFQRHAPVLEVAQAEDLGVFIISPADKGGMLYAPPPLLRNLCQPLSPLALNYRFLLSDRRITTLSVGAAIPTDLDGALELADRTDPLSLEEQAILTRLDNQQQQLGTDRCSQCYACLPCPQEIQIPEVLRLRNLALAYDMTEFGQYRYRMFEQAGHWFPGSKASRCTDCGDCLPRCPEMLKIPALLRETHEQLNGPARRRLWDS